MQSIVIRLIYLAHLHISSANGEIALLAWQISWPMGSALSSSLIKINILEIKQMRADEVVGWGREGGGGQEACGKVPN